MKKLVLMLVLLLSGCTNIQFLEGEYKSYVETKIEVEMLEPSCGELQNKEVIDKVYVKMYESYLYTHYLKNREDLKKATTDALVILKELKERKKFSIAYCTEKAKLLNSAIESILIIEGARLW